MLLSVRQRSVRSLVVGVLGLLGAFQGSVIEHGARAASDAIGARAADVAVRRGI
jgi:hypothetical protein